MKPRRIAVLVAISGVALTAWWIGNHVSIEQIAQRESQLRTLIGNRPVEAVLIGVLVYSIVSLIPGTSGKSIICGWLFGLAGGVFIVVTGLTAAGVISFYLSRYLLREFVEIKFHHMLTRANTAISRDGAFYLLTVRMLHAPYTLVNYLSGASRISVWTFTWTTAVGLLPGSLLFVFLGTTLPTLNELAQQGTHAIVEPWLFVALIATGTFPWMMRRVIRVVRSARRPAGTCRASGGP